MIFILNYIYQNGFLNTKILKFVVNPFKTRGMEKRAGGKKLHFLPLTQINSVPAASDTEKKESRIMYIEIPIRSDLFL